MFYIINIGGESRWTHEYTLYDTCTDSMINCSSAYMVTLLKHRELKVQNATIVNEELVIKEWYNPINNKDKKMSVLYHIENGVFKIVNANGNIDIISKQELVDLASSNMLANCRVNTEGTALEYMDVRTDSIDVEFKQMIDIKYRNFIAKSLLFGTDNRFLYDIDGHQVRLLKYIGRSKEVVVPNFVTTIARRAFYTTDIESIRIGTGVKHIGAFAFETSDLLEIEIPESVEYVFQFPFRYTKLKRANIKVNSDITLMFQ